MGIREYLEKNKGDMKLQEFSVETVDEKKDRWIDADQDISDEDWKRLVECIELLVNKGCKDNPEYLVDLKVGFPQHFQELDIGNYFDKISSDLSTQIEKEQWFSVLTIAYALKTLYPERFDESSLDQYYDMIAASIRRISDDVVLFQFADCAAKLKVVFPDRFEEVIPVDAAKRLERDRANSMFSYLWSAASLRVIDSEFDRISKSDWESANKLAEEALADDSSKDDYVGLVRNMRILGADKIELDDNGLKLIMPKRDLKQEKKPRPERLEF